MDSSSQFFSVERFAQKHPSLTTGSLRWQIFNRATNGLEASGAIIQLRRRILIDEVAFVAWLRDPKRLAIGKVPKGKASSAAAPKAPQKRTAGARS